MLFTDLNRYLEDTHIPDCLPFTYIFELKIVYDEQVRAENEEMRKSLQEAVRIKSDYEHLKQVPFIYLFCMLCFQSYPDKSYIGLRVYTSVVGVVRTDTKAAEGADQPAATLSFHRGCGERYRQHPFFQQYFIDWRSACQHKL